MPGLNYFIMFSGFLLGFYASAWTLAIVTAGVLAGLWVTKFLNSLQVDVGLILGVTLVSYAWIFQISSFIFIYGIVKPLLGLL